MSLQFLVAVLNWLQEKFIAVADKHKATAALHAAKIKALQYEQDLELKSHALATKLANKIDNLLSE